MTERRVGVVYSSRDWRKPFQLHVRNHVRDTRVLVVRDERMAVEEPLDVLIVDDETSFLTGDLVEVLRAKGVSLIGVHDPADGGTGLARLHHVGIDVTLDAASTPKDIVDVLARLGGHTGDYLRLIAQLEAQPARSPVGVKVSVGGPPTVGKTEVAIALIRLLSSQQRALLIDAADTYPSIARRLHLALHPHVLAAFEEIRSAPLRTMTGGRPLAESLARRATGALGPELPYDVVCGLANPSDWQIVRGDDLAALLRRAAGAWRFVVCDTGPHLEDLVRLDRWPLSRAAITNADRIIGVCGPTPDGMLRFLDWLVDVAALSPVPVDVVVNQAPPAPSRQAEFEDQLVENAGRRIASITFLPDDAQVERAAWNGLDLRRSKFLKAMTPLANALQGAPMPAFVA